MWVPRFNAQFIRPVRENIKALLEAHEAEALEWANGGTAMEPYKIYRDALWYNTLRPVLSVVSQHSRLTFADDLSRIEESHTIYVEVEDQGPNPDELAHNVEKRVQAADMIIRSATYEEMMGSLEKGKTSLISIEIPDHDYAQFLRSKTRYMQIGSFTVTIQAIEMVNVT